ncbi:MAG: hypothetical protein ABSH20_15425 [Tepidisphaeraceae bacterium]|jgi:hypothetical protein
MHHCLAGNEHRRNNFSGRLMGAMMIPLLAALLAALLCIEVRAAEPTSRPTMLTRFPGAAPITLDLRQKSPQEMLDELTRQSGVKTRVFPANLWQTHPTPLADIDVKGASYWRALKEICRLAGLQVNGWDREVVLMAGAGRFGLTGDGPVSDSGSVMAMGQRIFRSHTADLQTGETRRVCTLNLLMYVDPRVRLVAWKPVCVTSARDEKGNDLRGGISAGVNVDRYSDVSAWQISQTVGLNLASRSGGTVVELKGYLPAVVVLRDQTLEIPEPLARKQFKQDVGTWTVELIEVKDKRPGQIPKAYEVDLAMQQHGQVSSFPKLDLGRLIQLVDAKGAALMRQRYEGTSTTSERRTQASLVYMQQTFGGEQIGPPAKLVIDVPVEMQEMGLPFEFHDLKLP